MLNQSLKTRIHSSKKKKFLTGNIFFVIIMMSYIVHHLLEIKITGVNKWN